MLNHTERELLESDQEDWDDDWNEEEWKNWTEVTNDAQASRGREMWDGKTKSVKEHPRASASTNAVANIRKPHTNLSLRPPLSGEPSFNDRFGARIIDAIFLFLVWDNPSGGPLTLHSMLSSIGHMATTCRRFCRLLWLAGRETGLRLWPSAISEHAGVAENSVANIFGDAYYALLAREVAWCCLEPSRCAIQRLPFLGDPGILGSITSFAMIPTYEALTPNSELTANDRDDGESEDEQDSVVRALSFVREKQNSRSIMAVWDEPLTSYEIQSLRGVEVAQAQSVPGVVLHDNELLHLETQDFHHSGLPQAVSTSEGELATSSYFSVCHHLGSRHVLAWSKLPLKGTEVKICRQFFPTRLDIEAVWFTDESTVVIAGPLIKETNWCLQCWALPPTSKPIAERSLPASVLCGVVPKRGPRALLMVSLNNHQVVAYRSCTLSPVKVWDCTAVVGSLLVAPEFVNGLVAWRGTDLLRLETNGEVSRMAQCIAHPGSSSKGSLFHLRCQDSGALGLYTEWSNRSTIQVFTSSSESSHNSLASWIQCLRMQVNAFSKVLHIDSRKLIVLQDDHRLIVHFWPVGFLLNRSEAESAPLATIDLGRRLFGDCPEQCAQISCAMCGIDASIGLLWIVAVSSESPAPDEYGRARVGLWMRRGDALRRREENAQIQENRAKRRNDQPREEVSDEAQRPRTEKEMREEKRLQIAARQAAKKSLQAQRDDAAKRRGKDRALDKHGY